MDKTLSDSMMDAAQQLADTAIESGGDIALWALIATILIFVLQSRRAVKIEKQENYLALELASNDLFKFEADNAAALAPFRESEPPAQMDKGEETRMDAFLFMTLNLFEISIRLRKNKTIEPDVFGSWVIWYYDTLDSWYFRERWPEMRENYTEDLRDVFDDPVAQYDTAADDDKRKRAFFTHVAKNLKCPIITNWLPKPDAAAQPKKKSPSSRLTKAKPSFAISAAKDAATIEAARAFFYQELKPLRSYISHSEYFQGRSTDGERWSPQLESIIREEFDAIASGVDGNRELLVAQDSKGEIAACAVLLWDENGSEKFGVIEDLAVAQASRRHGLGDALLDRAEKMARERDCAKLVLESGAGNDGAHAFFEKQGFRVFSKVFVKRL